MTDPAEISRRALRLFAANHPDANPHILAQTWDNDPELRAFWVRQIMIALGIDHA